MKNVLAVSSNAGAVNEGIRVLKEQHRLVLSVASRELTRRNTGHALGALWLVLHPLSLTLVYIFIFGIVFKQRMGGTVDLPLDYTTYILSGLIPWFSFLGALNTSCNSIVGNSNLVKQFVFPLEVLPAKDAVMALVVWGVGMTAILIYTLVVQRTALVTWLLLPAAFVIQLGMMLGLAFLLSALTVFVRDLKDVIQVFGTVNIFLMPVVYLPTAVPALFRPLIYANPFSYPIWVYRDILYFGRIDHPWAWGIFALETLVFFAVGYRVFRRLKPHFGNVL